MLAEFVVAPITAGFAYGAMAPAILADLAERYKRELGIQARHWALWVLPTGTAVPVPTQIDPSLMPVVRLCQLFKQTLQQISQVESHSIHEADRFSISTAIAQLNEVHSLRVA
jgi:hypothetical protein